VSSGQALLEATRRDDGVAFARLAEVRRFDGSDNLVVRYRLGPDAGSAAAARAAASARDAPGRLPLAW
jgi:hypothetical protein